MQLNSSLSTIHWKLSGSWTVSLDYPNTWIPNLTFNGHIRICIYEYVHWKLVDNHATVRHTCESSVNRAVLDFLSGEINANVTRNLWNGTILYFSNSNKTFLKFIWDLIISLGIIFQSFQWAHDAIITSLLWQNDVATSFWRNNDVVIAPCARWADYATTPYTKYIDSWNYWYFWSKWL